MKGKNLWVRIVCVLICAVSSSHPAAGDEFYDAAIKQFNEKNFDAAVVLLAKAIQKNPKHNEAYQLRGMIHLVRGENKAAIADLSAAIALDKSDPDVFYYRCVVEKNIYDYKAAIADCSVAIKMNPKKDSAYNERGLAYYFIGSVPQALEDLDLAIALRPHPGYLNNRGFVNLNALNADAAIDDFTAALAHGFADSSALVNRARAQILKKSYKKARADLEDALKMNAAELNAYINLARLEALDGDLDKCKGHLDYAVEQGFRNTYDLERDPEFGELRKTKYYDVLIAKIKANSGKKR